MSSKQREALERSTIRLIGVADCYPEIRHLMQSQIKENEAALAEPPRNCDMLSADKCKQIFKREMGVYLPQEATDNDREIAQRTAYGVIDALFAPYTEQKGEGDGRK